jgi:hypothetical protein
VEKMKKQGEQKLKDVLLEMHIIMRALELCN